MCMDSWKLEPHGTRCTCSRVLSIYIKMNLVRKHRHMHACPVDGSPRRETKSETHPTRRGLDNMRVVQLVHLSLSDQPDMFCYIPARLAGCRRGEARRMQGSFAVCGKRKEKRKEDAISKGLSRLYKKKVKRVKQEEERKKRRKKEKKKEKKGKKEGKKGKKKKGKKEKKRAEKVSSHICQR